MIEAFVWDDRFLTGVEAVDIQHKRLFELINQVGEMLLVQQTAGEAAIEEVFLELENYVKVHFRDEEAILQAEGLDARHAEHHIRSHRDFAAQLKTLWNQRKSLSAPAETLHGFLVAWLSYHVLGEDQAWARLLYRQRHGADAATAMRDEPQRGERSTAALLQALRQLYTVLSRMNRDLEQSNRDLEAKVEARTRELVQAEKMASIGQLAAGMAHEINNPIGFVNANLGALEHYAAELLELAELGAQTPAGRALAEKIDLPFVRDDLADLVRESRDGLARVSKIVADLREFARIDQTGWHRADLIEGLESAISVAAHELGKCSARLVRLLAPLPPVRCLASQINQVFLSLLVNAAQAIRTGGTITLSSGQTPDQAQVWVEVADDGCGMDEKTLSRLFDPFFTTKPVGTGTGLGMAVSFDIVKKHGGRIDVDSQPGQGTRVRVWLPVKGQG